MKCRAPWVFGYILIVLCSAACGFTQTPEHIPTPDIEGTVDARIKQRDAEAVPLQARQRSESIVVGEAPTQGDPSYAPVLPNPTAQVRAFAMPPEPTPVVMGVPDPSFKIPQVNRPTPAPLRQSGVTENGLAPPRPTPTNAATSTPVALTPVPSEQLQDEATRWRELALELVNERRRELGLPMLSLGNSVASQLHAQLSLNRLDLIDTTSEGLPLEAMYLENGGRGFIKQHAWIAGYLDQESITRCASRRVICENVDPETDITDYIRDRLDSDMAEGGQGLLSSDWSKLHIGFAHTNLTYVIIEYLERQEIDYVREPSISGGFLSLEVIPRPGKNISQIHVYYYQPMLAAENRSSQAGELVLAVFDQPQSGRRRIFLDDISVVADHWTDDGQSVDIAVSLHDRHLGPGVYEVVTWVDEEVPASQYFVTVGDPKDLELDLALRPFDEPVRPSPESLRSFALDLINADRQKHGVPPVKLGTNDSAQIHAEDALKNECLVGHWTVNGLKPYMLYRLAGGIGVVAENAAGGGSSSSECQKPRVFCGLLDVEAQISDHQWGMMYDDAHANWGHRDTIINPHYDTVNIGIAFDDHRLAFYQHFEYNGVAYDTEPVLDGGLLRLRLRPLDGHAVGNVVVFFDPTPTPKEPGEIELLTSYCTGGGFTDECDDVGPAAVVLKPPPPGSRYVDLAPGRIVANVWSEQVGGSVEIEADLGSLVDKPGVYIVVIWSESEDPRVLSEYSIFR